MLLTPQWCRAFDRRCGRDLQVGSVVQVGRGHLCGSSLALCLPQTLGPGSCPSSLISALKQQQTNIERYQIYRSWLQNQIDIDLTYLERNL